MVEIKNFSLIVPAYKQEKTIVKNILLLQETLSNLHILTSFIVVVDGSLDKTTALLKKAKLKNVSIISYDKNQGKGYAVKQGVLHAQGDAIGFIDAGMDIDRSSIGMLINHMIWYNADIVIGSKLHPVSQVDYPRKRRVLSWGYRTLVHVLFGLKIRDSQVGLKIFKTVVAKKVFSKLTVKQFAFDIESLALAHHMGYKRIYEAPIKLKFKQANSSIKLTNFWTTILSMFWDTLVVFYRLKILRYYDKK